MAKCFHCRRGKGHRGMSPCWQEGCGRVVCASCVQNHFFEDLPFPGTFFVCPACRLVDCKMSTCRHPSPSPSQPCATPALAAFSLPPGRTHALATPQAQRAMARQGATHYVANTRFDVVPMCESPENPAVSPSPPRANSRRRGHNDNGNDSAQRGKGRQKRSRSNDGRSGNNPRRKHSKSEERAVVEVVKEEVGAEEETEAGAEEGESDPQVEGGVSEEEEGDDADGVVVVATAPETTAVAISFSPLSTTSLCRLGRSLDVIQHAPSPPPDSPAYPTHPRAPSSLKPNNWSMFRLKPTHHVVGPATRPPRAKTAGVGSRVLVRCADFTWHMGFVVEIAPQTVQSPKQYRVQFVEGQDMWVQIPHVDVAVLPRCPCCRFVPGDLPPPTARHAQGKRKPVVRAAVATAGNGAGGGGGGRLAASSSSSSPAKGNGRSSSRGGAKAGNQRPGAAKRRAHAAIPQQARPRRLSERRS